MRCTCGLFHHLAVSDNGVRPTRRTNCYLVCNCLALYSVKFNLGEVGLEILQRMGQTQPQQPRRKVKALRPVANPRS